MRPSDHFTVRQRNCAVVRGRFPSESDRVGRPRDTPLRGEWACDRKERNRHEPLTFSLNSAIKGWSEALQLMPVGSKWQLVVPPDVAYGERGAGQQIGPNATLIFEIELISIEDK
jgi:FKBP-type peptidyl-prolyl cis-trans isomerase 2